MMFLTITLQCIGIIVQGVVCLLLLRFAKSFGAYAEDYRAMTTQLLTTSETNMMLHRDHERMLEELRTLQTLTKGAA